MLATVAPMSALRTLFWALERLETSVFSTLVSADSCWTEAPMEPRVAATVAIAAVMAVRAVAAPVVEVSVSEFRLRVVDDRAPVVVEVVVAPLLVPSLVNVVCAVALKQQHR